jgi:hypothetical protein
LSKVGLVLFVNTGRSATFADRCRRLSKGVRSSRWASAAKTVASPGASRDDAPKGRSTSCALSASISAYAADSSSCSLVGFRV